MLTSWELDAPVAKGKGKKDNKAEEEKAEEEMDIE